MRFSYIPYYFQAYLRRAGNGKRLHALQEGAHPPGRAARCPCALLVLGALLACNMRVFFLSLLVLAPGVLFCILEFRDAEWLAISTDARS